MSHYQKFFELADADGSGYLTRDELIGTLRDNGYKGDDETLMVSKLTSMSRRTHMDTAIKHPVPD